MDDKKIKFFFPRVPTRLLQAHSLLDRNDRDLLVQVAAWYPKPCFYSVDRFTEQVLGVGEKAFYRSIYKLQLLGLIKINWGNRSKPNRYFYVPDPSEWRLPVPLEDEISSDLQKMGFQALAQKKSFPNEYGFKIAFNKKYPKYKIEVNENQSSNVSKNGNLTDASVRESLSPKEVIFFDWLKFLNSEHIPDTKIIIDYYKYKNEFPILKLNPEIGEFEKLYYCELEAKFFEIANNPTTNLALSILNLAINLEARGVQGEHLLIALREEVKKLRQTDKIQHD